MQFLLQPLGYWTFTLASIKYSSRENKATVIVSTAVAHTCPIYFQTHVAANPSPIISTVASKKRKVDSEGRRFQEKWELQYFFTDTRGNCVCLICQETVALFKEFNVKRHYQTKHANAYLCEQTFSVMNLNQC